VKSAQKQPSCEKVIRPLKSQGEKSGEIKGGSQEMAAMVLMLINFIDFNNDCGIIVRINIIAAISWPPPLISQLFSPRFFTLYQFFTAWLFFE